MILRGEVKNGVVVLHNGASLPEGTLVQVMPMPYAAGNPLALIAPMEAEPHLMPEDIAALQQVIAAGDLAARLTDRPFQIGE